ncbi:hypothetical protein NNQ27_22795 (plasmid) [Cronobacter dublinensis subsp. infanticibi]|uniref:hypothetical protein n=1 Tax=Cronobacter dublinensis TaxID=413497 RepID=UPI0023DCF4D0|nr:hypothetical protein [Cronobacter dublinensis]WEP47716.1 hypothetical protein NNQ27_22795 [Cronobacter dublinensis]
MTNQIWVGRIKTFYNEMNRLTCDDDFIDFTRKKITHGTPHVFHGREDDYYNFRKEIAQKYKSSFHDIHITGSAKLGFSYFKVKEFSFDSDIDTAIVSSSSFDYIMDFIYEFQMLLKRKRLTVTEDELNSYHDFLEYIALGWIRPDLLPKIFNTKSLRDNWFSFFHGLSYGKSTVGNYKVTAGIFKSYEHLEKYTINSLQLSLRKNSQKVNSLK